MKFTKRKPTRYTSKFYLVKCKDYCESGMQVARFDNGYWTNDLGDDITEYVTEWALITIK